MSRSAALGPLMIDVAGLELEAVDRELLAHPLVGGVILFSRNYEDPQQLTGLVKAIRSIREPLLIAVDHEGGRVQRFRTGFTELPPAAAIGDGYADDPSRACELAAAMGQISGRELAGSRIDLGFAPVVDVDSGISDIIGDRAWHRDPAVVSELAACYMRGLASSGLKATAKHFPGHGAVREDSHVALPIDDRELEEIRQHDLQPYRRLIADGLPSVMMAHVVFTRVDERPAGFSPRWIRDELRQRLGFSGAVFCDDLSMAGAAVIGGVVERCEAATEAGCDMLPLCNDRAAVEQVLDQWRPAAMPEGEQRLAALTADRGAEPAPVSGVLHAAILELTASGRAG